MIQQAKTNQDFKGIYDLHKCSDGKLSFMKAPLLLRLLCLIKGRKYFILKKENKVIGFVSLQKDIGGDLLVSINERHKGFGEQLRIFAEDIAIKKYGQVIIFAPAKTYLYYERRGYKILSTKKSLKGDVRMVKNE